MFSDTIAAIATAPGKAGVAIVRVSGPEAFGIAAKLAGGEVKPGRIQYRILRRPRDGRMLDDAVVLAFRGPRSYTGEDVVEFQGHGGSITPRRVLEAVFAEGARLARRGEFTERAFLNGRIDLEQAEGVLDLINAKTEGAADAALEGLGGAKKREWRDLYERTLEISSELEHALDIDEDELPEGFFAELARSIDEVKTGIAAAIERERRGRVMREGALVVLAGAPNAGKSSLMNALLEENRAIVSDVPGTTRDSIEAWLDLGGYPVRLVDTAGLRESEDAIESEGVRRAQELLAKADVIVALDPLASRSSRLLDCPLSRPPLLVQSKCDLDPGPAAPLDPPPPGLHLRVSARTGEGLDELRRRIVERIAALEPKEEPRGVDLLLEAKRWLDGVEEDPVLAANAVRSAAEALGRLVGATYSEDLLDRLFSRFCVGK